MIPKSGFHHQLPIVDSIAPFSHIKKNGYYIVGKKIFVHKLFALQESTRTGQEIKFYFFDEEFNRVDWRQRSGVPLLELYRMRAQQLREKYDYIICNFSGGADSTTIIESFVNNNIKLDEVLVSWPLRYLKGRFPISRNLSAKNLMSEWDLAIQPKLDQLRRDHPEIKITIADYSDDLGTNEDSDDSVIYTAKCNYIGIKKHRAIDCIVAERQKKFNNIVSLTGINPVACRIIDDYLTVTFEDEACNGYRSDYLAGGYIRNVEFFYWTIDLPEIVKEQAHIYLQYLNQYPGEKHLFGPLEMQPDKTFIQRSKPDMEKYRRLGKKLFYPNWDNNIFQANKAKIWTGKSEWYSWYYNNNHSLDSMQSWQSMIDSHNRLISSKFLNILDGEITGFRTLSTKNFVIGKLQLNR